MLVFIVPGTQLCGTDANTCPEHVLPATSPNAGSELEQARPQTSGEEELQLQLALAMSREAAEQVHTRTQMRGNTCANMEEHHMM